MPLGDLNERRHVTEVVTLHELEPELHNVYVEGEFDAAVISRYLNSTVGRASIQVLPIGLVDIPSEMLAQRGLSSGERQRVIVLALELEAQLGGDCSSASCVIDSDLDAVLGISHVSPLLARTDFPTMEGYLLSSQSLARVSWAVRNDHISAEFLATVVMSAAAWLFTARYVLRARGLDLRRLDIGRSCRLAAGNFVFDRESYLLRTVQAAGVAGVYDGALAEIDADFDSFDGDTRQRVDGHDFVELAAAAIRRLVPMPRGRDLGSEAVVESLLLAAFVEEDLSDAPLFAWLVSRTRSV